MIMVGAMEVHIYLFDWVVGVVLARLLSLEFFFSKQFSSRRGALIFC